VIPLALATLSPWGTWLPATCTPADCFCETVHEGLIRQPANTWSSLAFLLAALWVAGKNTSRAKREGAVLGPAETWLFVSSLLIVGLGSAFYHASLTFVGQVVDVSGMYLIATFMLLHRLGPRWGVPPAWSVVGFVALNAALMAAQVTTPSLRRIAFGLLLVAAVGVEWRSSRAGRRWLGAGAVLMGIAFAIWALDRWRILCAPESLLQGHALWHVLGAIAAAFVFRSYAADVRD